MAKIKPSNFSFNSPVKGTDPITKGTFIIEWAWFINDFWAWKNDASDILEAKGSFTISGEDNPLYDLVKDTPLRLQEITASIDFGTEKKFIQIKSIGHFEIYKEKKEIYLSQVIFEILDNLDYLQKVQEYKDENLL